MFFRKEFYLNDIFKDALDKEETKGHFQEEAKCVSRFEHIQQNGELSRCEHIQQNGGKWVGEIEAKSIVIEGNLDFVHLVM